MGSEDIRELWRREREAIKAALQSQPEGVTSREVDENSLNGLILTHAHLDPSYNEQHHSSDWSLLIKIRTRILSRLLNKSRRSSAS